MFIFGKILGLVKGKFLQNLQMSTRYMYTVHSILYDYIQFSCVDFYSKWLHYEWDLKPTSF